MFLLPTGRREGGEGGALPARSPIGVGHAVDGLLQALETAGLPVDALRPLAKRLDRHYVPTRYPNGLPGNVPSEVYGEADSSEALAAARRIVDFARNQLERAG